MESSTIRGNFTQFEVWQLDENGNTHLRATTRYLESAQAAAKDWAEGSPSKTAYIRINFPVQIMFTDITESEEGN